jgi:hypothetical protein
MILPCSKGIDQKSGHKDGTMVRRKMHSGQVKR